MALEIVGELLGGVFRVAFHFVVEVILELAVRGVGYLICKPFSKTVNPDGFVVVVVGLLFWLVVIVLAFLIYEFFEVDRCLDRGGAYDYDSSSCDFGS